MMMINVIKVIIMGDDGEDDCDDDGDNDVD